MVYTNVGGGNKKSARGEPLIINCPRRFGDNGMHATTHPSSPSNGSLCDERSWRLRQVDDSIEPVPRVTISRPEFCEQACLVAVIGAPNGPAEQDEAAVTLSRTKDLTCVPRKRCAIECHEHQTGLGTGDQERCVIETEP